MCGGAHCWVVYPSRSHWPFPIEWRCIPTETDPKRRGKFALCSPPNRFRIYENGTRSLFFSVKISSIQRNLFSWREEGSAPSPKLIDGFTPYFQFFPSILDGSLNSTLVN